MTGPGPGPGLRHRPLAAAPALARRKLLQSPSRPPTSDVEALLLIGLYQLLHTRIPAHAAIGGSCRPAPAR